MKKILFVAAMFFVMGGPKAQSIAEARKLLYYERYDGAAHCLQSLLRIDPNNAEAWWLLTRAYLHNGRERALRDSLLLMPAVARQQPFALCAYGRVLLAEHKKDSATGCFTRALAITREKDPLILLAIARAHQAADSGDAAPLLFPGCK